MKMKEFLIKVTKVISNILLVISILGLVASGVLMVINQAIDNGMLLELAQNKFFNWLTLERIGTVTAYLGVVVTAGGISKIASSTLKTVVQSSKSELERQAVVYETKIDKLRDEHIDATVLLAEKVNQLTDAQKQTALVNDQVLEVMLITARRNIKSNLVGEQEKQLYRKFINDVKSKRQPQLENIYMTIVEQAPKVEEKGEVNAEEYVDILTKIINKREE